MQEMSYKKDDHVILPIPMVYNYVPEEMNIGSNNVIGFTLTNGEGSFNGAPATVLVSTGHLAYVVTSFPIATPKARYVDETEVKRYYDILPEEVDGYLLKDYRSKMESIRDELDQYLDIDLPIVDDGGDW